jgi:hypothetical protein
VLQEGFFDPTKSWFIRRGQLPHWRQDGALYFVTFRLSDSLPQSKLRFWREQRRAWAGAAEEVLHRLLIRQNRHVEAWLDRGTGSCILRDQDACGIVEEELRRDDGRLYELGPSTVASNHVHALLRTAPGVDLSEVTNKWKGRSARRIGKLRDVRARNPNPRHLWQIETLDHIVRNQASLERIGAYIGNHVRSRSG